MLQLNPDAEYNETFEQLSKLSVTQLEQMESLFEANERKVRCKYSARQLKKMSTEAKLIAASGILDKMQSMMHRQQMNLLIRIKSDPKRKAELIENVKCDKLRQLIAKC